MRSVIGLAGYGVIAVFTYDREVVLESELLALSQLPLDGLFSLCVAGIPCIDYRFDILTSNRRFLLSTSMGMILDCRSIVFIPL